MRVNTHLSFNGQCEDAFRFYAECLDAKLEIMLTYGESQMASQVPAEFQSRILHTSLATAQDTITGADEWPADAATAKGFTMSLNFTDAPETERIFHALAKGGTITLPLQKTFWTPLFGMLTDRFGIPWMVNLQQS
jgi:PhnB protein